MSCCAPQGSDEEVVGECPECGGPVDEGDDSTEICEWSPGVCGICGFAPCDESC